jgi:hypothetical protein
MYKTRYSFTKEFLGTDDVRLNPVRADAPKQSEAKQRRVFEPLDSRAKLLLRDLPADQSLSYTAANFPHLVNRMAAVWNDARLLRRFVDELLLDERGGRAGFPYETLNELIMVRESRLEYLTGKRTF